MLKAIIGMLFTQHNYYLVTFVIKFLKLDTNCFPRICDVSLNIISEHCQNDENLSTIVVIWEVSSYVLYCVCLYIREYSSTLYVGMAQKKMAAQTF